MNTKNNYSNYLIYLGLIALVPGILAVSIPDFTVKTLIIILGIIIALSGITTMILRLKNKKNNPIIQALHIIGSFINIIFGLILVFMPETFVEIFIIIFGITVLLAGLSQLIISISFKPIQTSAIIFSIISLLIIAAGIVMILNPFEIVRTITIFLGIILCVYAVLNIIMAFWIKSFINSQLISLPDKENIVDAKIVE